MQFIGHTKQRIIVAINEQTARFGYPPSLRDISKEVGRSTTVVRSHLLGLRKQGYITFLDGKARTCALTDEALAMIGQ